MSQIFLVIHPTGRILAAPDDQTHAKAHAEAVHGMYAALDLLGDFRLNRDSQASVPAVHFDPGQAMPR